MRQKRTVQTHVFNQEIQPMPLPMSLPLPLPFRPFPIVANAYKKKTIPSALRQATWTTYNGTVAFQAKCHVTWCENVITPFSFEVGHNIPESKGGALDLGNLRPICVNCNRSMGNTFTIDEFSALSKQKNQKQSQQSQQPKSSRNNHNRPIIIKQSRGLFSRCFCS